MKNRTSPNKHNEGASILTLKQQNTVSKKNTIFSKYVDCRIFDRFSKPVLFPIVHHLRDVTNSLLPA